MALETVPFKVFQDFSFHNLELLRGFVLPASPLAAQNIAAEGSMFYDQTSDIPYVSDGTQWLPVITGSADIPSAFSLTAPSIALTADTTDITLTAATDVTVSPTNTFTATGAEVHLSPTVGIFLTPGASGHIYLTVGAASQSLSINNPVTVDSINGIITTFNNPGTAAHSADTFTVNNALCDGTGSVQATVVDYFDGGAGGGVYGTNGLPLVNVSNVQNGSFDLVVINAHDANALLGSIGIFFRVYSSPV